MKILYGALGNNSIDLAWALTELGHQVVSTDVVFSRRLLVFTKEEEEALLREVTRDEYDFVITYNFAPLMAHVCNKVGLLYVSWVFDSLLIPLYLAEARYSCNRIFIFDRREYERVAAYGVKNIWYLPMAANCSRINGFDITEEDIARYATQISFVGNLYQDNNDYDRVRPYLKGERKQKWDNRLRDMACRWGDDKRDIYRFLDEEDMRFVKSCYGQEHNPIGMDDNLYYGFNVLCYELAGMERRMALERLAERFYVDLYTNSADKNLRGVHAHGTVDYLKESGKIFYASKINLQLTMPSIETGISQRVYDIMAVGGFVLSNYQQEYETLFEPDRDVVLFRDLDEMMRKAEYYLTHERERLMIAVNGYRKVNDKHNYILRVQELLDKLKETEENGEYR